PRRPMHDVEDIYPLSPLQRGFLFHSLYAPAAGEHLLQITCTLHGALDVPRFQAACAGVVAAHPALRTAFVWQDLDEPLQVVRRVTAPELVRLDWQDLDDDAQRRALAAFLAEDRRRGFALDRPPLMRWALVRTGADRHVLVWTCHHLLVQCVAAYDAALRGDPPPAIAARPYRDYIAWLVRQPPARAERYWRDRLRGFGAATPLPLIGAVRRDADAAHGCRRRVLAAGLDDRLAAFTRSHAITPSTFFQAVWALLLARYTGHRDLVFGTTVAGRPAELAGVETMVGMFINTLP